MPSVSAPIALPIEQWIYTSFPKVGFRSLTSSALPITIQQFFLQRIVYRYWDVYNPPPAEFRAIFLHQIERHQLIFGWIYNDGTDDLGRSHTPYVLGCYLPQAINGSQLESVLDILERGPMVEIDRSHPLPTLAPLPHLSIDYVPCRAGVAIAPSCRQSLCESFQKCQLLDFYLDCHQGAIASNSPQNHLSPSLQSLLLRTSTIMERIEKILLELTTKPIGIQGVVLVSEEGQPITPPIGLDENMVQIVAGTMLYLAKSSEDECHWSAIDHIAIRAPEGHLILSRCPNRSFLLVKAGKVMIGLLDGEIKRTIQRLDEVFKASEAMVVQNTIPESSLSIDDLSNLSAHRSSEAIAPESDSILYRGRPAR